MYMFPRAAILHIVTLLLACCLPGKLMARSSNAEEQKKAYQNARSILQKSMEYEGDDFCTYFSAQADSLWAEGARLNNYMISIVSLKLKAAVALKENRDWESMQCYDECIRLALEHNNKEEYFHSIYLKVYQEEGLDPALAIRDAKQLIVDAHLQRFPKGLIRGHTVLGEIYLYYLYDFEKSREEYSTALDLLEVHTKGDNENRQALLSELLKCDYNVGDQQAYEKRLKQLKKIFDGHRPDIECDVSVTELDKAFHDNVAPDVYLKMYEEVAEDPTFKIIFSEETQVLYRAQALFMRGKKRQAISMLEGLEQDFDIMRCLREMYLRTGDNKRADKMVTQMSASRDSLSSAFQRNDLALLESTINYSVLELENERQMYQSRTHMMLAVATICLLLMLFFIYRKRQVQKHSDALLEKNRQLAEARDRAERAYEVKHKFVQNMNHEMRTPLNHVYGFAQLLADESVAENAESRQMAVQSICEGSQALQNMLEDIMMLTELESTEDVETESLLVAELMEEVFGKIPQKNAGQVTFILENGLPEGFEMKANKKYVSMVLANLLSNANKFASEGYVKLCSRLTDKTLVFAVEDTGVGIPAELHERVFERFFKVDEFMPGVGLGLSICQVIAEKQKARVYVDPDYAGPGCRFVYELPTDGRLLTTVK